MWWVLCSLSWSLSWRGLSFKSWLMWSTLSSSWSKRLGFWVNLGCWSTCIVHHEFLKGNTLFLWELIGDHIISHLSRQPFQQITDLHQQFGLFGLRFCWSRCSPWRSTWSLTSKSCRLLSRHRRLCFSLCIAACSLLRMFLFSLPLSWLWIWYMRCWSNLGCS